jgi:hypothetical protein
MIATIKPRDLVGKTRRRLAVELIVELEAIDKKIKAVKKELAALVEARGSTLMGLTGVAAGGVPVAGPVCKVPVGCLRASGVRPRLPQVASGTTPVRPR